MSEFDDACENEVDVPKLGEIIPRFIVLCAPHAIVLKG
jgi:hypothetical protein